MLSRPPLVPNVQLFKVNHRINPPHEKSLWDLSTSTANTKLSIAVTVEEQFKSNLVNPEQKIINIIENLDSTRGMKMNNNNYLLC